MGLLRGRIDKASNGDEIIVEKTTLVGSLTDTTTNLLELKEGTTMSDRYNRGTSIRDVIKKNIRDRFSRDARKRKIVRSGESIIRNVFKEVTGKQ